MSENPFQEIPCPITGFGFKPGTSSQFRDWTSLSDANWDTFKGQLLPFHLLPSMSPWAQNQTQKLPAMICFIHALQSKRNPTVIAFYVWSLIWLTQQGKRVSASNRQQVAVHFNDAYKCSPKGCREGGVYSLLRRDACQYSKEIRRLNSCHVWV